MCSLRTSGINKFQGTLGGPGQPTSVIPAAFPGRQMPQNESTTLTSLFELNNYLDCERPPGQSVDSIRVVVKGVLQNDGGEHEAVSID